MNFLYRYLIRKADKIKATEKLKQESENVKQQESWKELLLVRKEAFEKIGGFFNGLVKFCFFCFKEIF